MKNLLTLENKSIIITGASSGIGRQCAITASQLGATIALLGRNRQRLEETFAALKPGNHAMVSGDVTEYEQLEERVGQIVKQLGTIDGFIHAAGIEMTKPLRVMSHHDYESLFGINVIAGFELARIISHKKHLSAAGASFIYLSSVMGILGQPGKVGYCASKGALLSSVKALALELAQKKVRVNCLLLGLVETEMARNLLAVVPEDVRQAIIRRHLLGMGTPADVSNYCVFLLSDLSRWITGSSIVMDGGYSAA
jgi:NAD(P)-dependent dehydrogenase (short-subunit alcohol dehydrogenase family)